MLSSVIGTEKNKVLVGEILVEFCIIEQCIKSIVFDVYGTMPGRNNRETFDAFYYHIDNRVNGQCKSTDKIFKNVESASKDADNNYNTISSNPKINEELVTTIYSVKVYDKKGKEITIYDYTPAVFGTEDSVDSEAADVLVPDESNFSIVQRNHYHAAANGFLGTWGLNKKGLFPTEFPGYFTEHFSARDISVTKLGTIPTGVATPGYYDYYVKKYDLVGSSWIYDPISNQVKFLGNVKTFENYNSSLWHLNEKNEPKIKEIIIKSGVTIELDISKLKGLNK